MAHADHGPKYLAHHFDTPKQQFESAKLGMWLFLAQEILFFSGLFVAYGVFRTWYPESFSVGSHLLDWKMGALNTVVLLFSSFTAAMAVRAAQIGEQTGVPEKDQHKLGGRKWTSIFLIITFFCAAGFMVVKYLEYSHKIHVGTLPGQFFGHPGFDMASVAGAEFYEEMEKAGALAYESGGHATVPFHLRTFFGIYFVMTGLHGIHVLIGMGLLLWILKRNASGEFSAEYNTPVDIFALYWHLVDLIWIFLFPLLYLID
ncbi:MAG: cytochrome C oxidase subunit III [Sandaracinus sp.]|nr:cytochrome C oxidase subunit III [Sandaracinus sp.]|tara:strand:- start:520 stop:1296 length:777 start_codon:yes stop_codon:yes gene_type:complete